MKTLITYLSIAVGTIAFTFGPAHAQEVVVEFDRELPFKSYHFTRTFEDKDEFEMWLATRLEDKGCDPYLKSMKIKFK
jgi:hypothetical protein